MKSHILFFIPVLVLSHNAHAAVKCSQANLTRCLDSACAINISSNPAARCQYCGTSNAGTPPKTAMRGVSVGTSAKYNISDKDLKKAPTEPGKRYAWATTECIKKVSGCTADDVSEIYDPLIEQSCKAAGISAQMNKSISTTNKQKTQSMCQTTIQSCIISDTHCMADYRNCKSDSDFDKFIAACSVESAGCDAHLSSIRAKILSDRDNAIQNTELALTQLVASYQKARENKLNSTISSCKNNTAKQNCINTVCARNMPNKCNGEFGANERVAANALCDFYDTACATVD